MKKHWSSKTVSIIFASIILIINSSLLFGYYNFYLSDKLINNFSNIRETTYQEAYEISKMIKEQKIDDAIDIIDNYVLNNGGYVTLKRFDGKVLYTNQNRKTNYFNATSLITIDNAYYELTYSKRTVMTLVNLVRDFVFLEIIFVSLLIIINLAISSKNFMSPLDQITKDIKDYQFGKKPIKRKMPKRMQQIQNSFVDLVDNLEMEKENQNRIIASISHDIKTPLTSIIGYADRLKNINITPEKRKIYVDKIYNQSLLMKGILEEFDDYQSCNIKDSLKLEKVAISDFIKMIENDYEDELLDKDIKLIINSDCDNANINIDLVKMKRVLSNIITNSVRHMKNKNKLIRINIYRYENMIKFEVCDNGSGVKEERDLKRIFEPLYTTDPSRRISGLGLSICNEIISVHAGKVYAENNDLGGLSIIFLIPEFL